MTTKPSTTLAVRAALLASVAFYSFASNSALAANTWLQVGRDAIPDTPKNRMIRQCIQAVHGHWPRQAGLMLPNRARMQVYETGYRSIDVTGMVWDQGQRKEVAHRCHFTPEEGFVLNVGMPEPEPALLAGPVEG